MAIPAAQGGISSPGGRRGILLAIVLMVVVVAYLYVVQSARSQVPDHGDFWTDMAHILAVRNINQYGFSPLCFGVTRDNGPEIGLPPAYYTHHPSFPMLVLSLFSRLGFSSTGARIGPLLFSGSALIAIYLLTCRMLGDWRPGIVALLALAASAPFRLLADAFGYQSYDFAAKMWSMLFVTLGSLAGGRRRLAWFIVAGVSAFITIALSSFEMVPAICAYSVLFPLLFASTRWKESFQAMLTSGLCVSAGLLVGMLSRLIHNSCMLGGLGQAIADFVAAFVFRSSSDYSGVMWGHHYLPELVYRTWAYYYLYLTVIIFGMVVIRSIPVARRECLNWRTLKWLGLIFFSETLWYLIFREHSHRHVHTIYHLSLSMSLAAALVFWEVTGCSRLVRSRVLVAGIGLFAISLASVGVRPYGNLQIKLDWNWRRRQINLLSSLLPADAVVVLDLGDMDPSPEFFLERTFVRRLEVVDPVGFQGRPGFLITQPKEGNPVYDKSLVKNRLIALTQEFALFDVRAAGGALNAIVAGGPKRENLNAWGMRLSGFIMHPAAPGLEDHAVLNIVLPADEANTLTFWVVQPGWVANATDGVALTFGVGQSNRADMSSFGVFLDPAKIQKKRDWAAVDVVVPRSDTASILRIEAGCGAGRNCDSDWVWVAPVGNRYR